MSGTASSRSTHTPRCVLVYVLAVVLPVFNTWLTQHVALVRAVPYSPHLLAVVIIGLLGGLAPSLLSIAFVLLCRSYLLLTMPQLGLTVRSELLHASVLVIAALLVWLMNAGRQRSDRKLGSAMAELQERTESLVASLNASKCASWTFNMDSGTTPRWYSGSYQVFGRGFDELEAMPSILPLVHADDHPRLPQLIEHLLHSSEPLVFEYRCLWPNGELHTLEMRGNKVSLEPCIWRGITVDITERKLTEAALLRAEKLAAMGRLASTVAHEINNPLEAVTNLLYLARSDEAISSATQAYLSAAERELSRLSNITRLTLGFVRTSGSVADTAIAPIVDEVISIFQHRLQAEHVTVQRDYQPGVRISIAPHELRQIATNLIANAADAIAHTGGRIRVTIASEGPHAVFCVEDNGSGIAAANLPRIFEPFFSTKEEVGTGIGLWVTRELVEKNGGHISVHSDDLPNGLRTRFRVDFPLAQD